MTPGDLLWCACIAAEVAALSGAVVLARRALHRGCLTLVALLAFALVADLAIGAGHRWIFTAIEHPVREAIARLGWPARLAYHVETALVTGWPARLALAAWRVFGTAAATTPATRAASRPPDLVLGCYLGLAIGLAALYPLPPGRSATVLHLWELGCVTVAGAAIVAAWRRGSRRPWCRARVAVGLLWAVELTVATVGPFVVSPYRTWHLATVAYLLGFVALAGLQASWIARLRRGLA